MSKVSRAVYQKLSEKHKALMSDMRKIVMQEPKGKETFVKWRKHFLEEHLFHMMLKDVAKKYLKEHPEHDVTSPQFRINPEL